MSINSIKVLASCYGSRAHQTLRKPRIPIISHSFLPLGFPDVKKIKNCSSGLLLLRRSIASSTDFIPEQIESFPVQPLSFDSIYEAEDQAVVEESKGSGKDLHAVVSAFDLFSIGIGPSSSHTVGPMRAAKIFISDLKKAGALNRVKRTQSKGHMSPEALIAGFEGHGCETVETHLIPSIYKSVVENKSINLGIELDEKGRGQTAYFDIEKDMVWLWDQVLPQHPNGMLFSVYDDQGDLIASNKYFSVGGGFVVNSDTHFSGENLYYKQIDKNKASLKRLDPSDSKSDKLQGFLPTNDLSVQETQEEDSKEENNQPPLPFHNGDSLLELTRKHNLTIAQVVFNNERQFYTPEEIKEKVMKIYRVMDESIKQGVCSEEETLPGRLGVKRRARNLYRRLHRGFFPSLSDVSSKQPPSLSFTKPNLLSSEQSKYLTNTKDFNENLTRDSNVTIQHRGQSRSPLVIRGRFDHDIPPISPRRTSLPSMDFLSCYAIAVNEVNASGGRIVTAPTNGAAGVIPSVLKYFLEFISEDPEQDTMTFLLTAAAIGMLYKRGATISAAEGGCMAEVGVACSMAAGAFAACMGGSPEVVEAAAEIGIEHCLGLTCDPIDGLVQIPCIERNALGAVKAVTAAQLALSGDGIHSVSLDEAIDAMRQTAKDMSSKYKETSRAGLATSVKGARISVAVPDC
ncbi:serine dehydratase alpha chain-domain-containing protein [Phakopsora pachyrhizi]|uniref:Serine dehydratase alpha chain-domain-containing protein n=1 Tax=Phakopsora pachyrhizi TaxID=170000 RepID=A0AAV0ANL2_PHAPC|nr:serine dehydratase alpha chain-domain-containing protein [Phakopsora pachyrhizi]